jgi:hypothetical protein
VGTGVSKVSHITVIFNDTQQPFNTTVEGAATTIAAGDAKVFLGATDYGSLTVGNIKSPGDEGYGSYSLSMSSFSADKQECFFDNFNWDVIIPLPPAGTVLIIR